MKTWLNWCAAWVAFAIQRAGREFDPELLLQPGGSVLAVVLWLYAKAAIGTRPATAMRAKSRQVSAAKMSSTAVDALAANLPSRIDDTPSPVMANWTNCGMLRICGRGAGTRL